MCLSCACSALLLNSSKPRTCLQTKPIQCDNDTRFWSIHPCVAIEGFSVLQHYRFVKFRIAVHIVYSLTYIYRVISITLLDYPVTMHPVYHLMILAHIYWLILGVGVMACIKKVISFHAIGIYLRKIQCYNQQVL